MVTVRPDAAKQVDAGPVVCTAAPSYSSVVSGSNGTVEFAGSDGSGSDYLVYWAGRLDPTAMPDFLEIDLYNGIGPFSAGITPQTISLTGDETDYALCAACVLLFTDLHQVGSDLEITDFYMPTAGTLTLTSTTDTFEGTLSNVMLQHMIISGNMLVPANDGCVSSIPSLTMNAEIEPQGSGSAWGKPAPGGKMSLKFKLSQRTF